MPNRCAKAAGPQRACTSKASNAPSTGRRRIIASKFGTLLLLALAGCSLTGCKLIDQTTFGAKSEPPGTDQLSLALRDPSRFPLVVIRSDGPTAAYNEALDDAVDSAVQRKPDVVFDVVTVVPGKGSATQEEAAVTQAQQDALPVVDRMADAGANPARIHLAARVDPTVQVQEIRIYVH